MHMIQPLHLQLFSQAYWCRARVAPNRSVEATSNGWPHKASCSFFTLCGQPLNAPHVERYVPERMYISGHGCTQVQAFTMHPVAMPSRTASIPVCAGSLYISVAQRVT
jgi:hypothetical protein